jgi:hypothetical protein
MVRNLLSNLSLTGVEDLEEVDGKPGDLVHVGSC